METVKSYNDWLKTLEKFKQASEALTFEKAGVKVKPGDAGLGTVEIRTNGVAKDGHILHVFINAEQAAIVVEALKRIFEL